LYADVSSILQPLLRGAAEITDVERVNEAREIIQSRSLLERIAIEAGLLTGSESEEQKAAVVSNLRRNIGINVSSKNYINLTYTNSSADDAFATLSVVLNQFIRETQQRKRTESRGAFEFIESQVQTYKRQLENAEENLKNFRASNLDGTEANVQNRIQTLRSSIEELNLRIQETQAQIELTKEQIADEDPFREITRSGGPTEISRRLSGMRDQLDDLRLVYHDTHPDIIAMRDQISELQERQAQGLDVDEAPVEVEVIENPVYESLRLRLTTLESDVASQRNRVSSQQQLLQTESSRAERVAANLAEETELMRDYNVTREVYEEMLRRRENARLSMTLDVEGQGVNYRIQEPASYPTRWNGLQMYHYGAAGPAIGFVLVFGLLGALVMVDGRIRSGRMLQAQLSEEVELLTSVPHYSSSIKARLLRMDVLVLGIVLAVFMGLYSSILLFSIIGIQPNNLLEILSSQLGGQG
jgi:polysaccharide chain length determinant protein (PEP-CTERM system associated)